ncbi:hypothetical protein ACHAW5_009140, partial [Stephanodiscus triporus]
PSRTEVLESPWLRVSCFSYRQHFRLYNCRSLCTFCYRSSRQRTEAAESSCIRRYLHNNVDRCTTDQSFFLWTGYWSCRLSFESSFPRLMDQATGIPLCTSTLLIVVGNTFGHGIVYYVSYIGFVDSHSECNGRTKNTDFSQTPFSVASAFLMRIQFCMIERNLHIAKALFSELLIQLVAYILTVLSAKAVDDTRIAPSFPGK